ncbi:DUF2293 domain-containing protein [Ciceribacter azotifigens]|uniref:DUF2293 domain-containing protein n=1 Tax=Ciceribacter azotifigens TaxID=2069303 RepID=UPI003A84F8F4
MPRFSIRTIKRHLRRHHPSCPDFAVEYFANEIANRDWGRAPLGQAVGITIQTFLRHEMTDYDTLLLSGMDRDEARRRVQPRINKMLQSWRRRPAVKELEKAPVNDNA